MSGCIRLGSSPGFPGPPGIVFTHVGPGWGTGIFLRVPPCIQPSTERGARPTAGAHPAAIPLGWWSRAKQGGTHPSQPPVPLEPGDSSPAVVPPVPPTRAWGGSWHPPQAGTPCTGCSGGGQSSKCRCSLSACWASKVTGGVGVSFVIADHSPGELPAAGHRVWEEQPWRPQSLHRAASHPRPLGIPS